jgi:hypothetical protein
MACDFGGWDRRLVSLVACVFRLSVDGQASEQAGGNAFSRIISRDVHLLPRSHRSRFPFSLSHRLRMYTNPQYVH